MGIHENGHIHLIGLFLLLVILALVYQVNDWQRKVRFVHDQQLLISEKLGRLEDRLSILELRYTSLKAEANPEIQTAR